MSVFTAFIKARQDAENNAESVNKPSVCRCHKHVSEGRLIISGVTPELSGHPGLSLLVFTCTVSMPAAVGLFVHRCRHFMIIAS